MGRKGTCLSFFSRERNLATNGKAITRKIPRPPEADCVAHNGDHPDPAPPPSNAPKREQGVRFLLPFKTRVRFNQDGGVSDDDDCEEKGKTLLYPTTPRFLPGESGKKMEVEEKNDVDTVEMLPLPTPCREEKTKEKVAISLSRPGCRVSFVEPGTAKDDRCVPDHHSSSSSRASVPPSSTGLGSISSTLEDADLIRKCLVEISNLPPLERVRVLLRRGIDPSHVEDHHKMTPLHIACRHDDATVIKLLVKSMVNVNLAMRTPAALRPIHIAAKKGSTRVLRYLLGHAECDINAKEQQHGNTATALAAIDGQTHALRMLLACDRVQWNITNNVDATPLAQAVYIGNINCVNLILHAAITGVLPSIPPDVVDKDGRIAIHRAALNGDTALIEDLMRHRANLNTEDANGFTPLFHAALRGHTKAVATLLRDPSTAVNFRWRHTQETALHRAAENGHAETCKELLAGQNVRVNSKDWVGRTAAHVAAQSGSYETLEAFVSRAGLDSTARTTVNLSSKCAHGGTVLHHVIAGYDEIGPRLIDTSVQLAMVKLLKDSGADLSIRDNNSRTPYMWAKEKERSEVAALLCPSDTLARELATPEGARRLVERRPSLALWDYVNDSSVSAEERDGRTVQVFVAAIRPRLMLCICKNCTAEDKQILKILLDRTQGQRKVYLAEFGQIVDDGIAKLLEDLVAVQKRLSEDYIGRQLVADTPPLQYFGGYNPQTLHQFNDECLRDNLTKTLQDDAEWIRVAKGIECFADAEGFLKLYCHGDHECLDQPYPELQAVGVKYPRENYVLFLLACLGHKLDSPFQQAMKTIFEPVGIVSPGQAKKFSSLLESSKYYATQRGVKFGCQFIVDMLRCVVEVENAEKLWKAFDVLKALTLKTDKVELRRIKNLHNQDAVAECRDVKATVVFDHCGIRLLAEVRLVLSEVITIQSGLQMLYACQRHGGD